jgi:hypothetical protein
MNYDNKVREMETKYILPMFIALAMLIGTASAQFNNALTMANVSVSPNPVMAGGNATIHFQLNDAYNVWLYGTTLQPSGAYPLLNASPLSENLIGIVNPGLSPVNYTYVFPIPSTTPAGQYTITFTADYFVYAGTGALLATSVMPVTFYVQNQPSIKLVAATPQSATLYTGHNQTITLLIENIGYGTARNVSVGVRAGPGLNILSPVTTFFISNLTQGSSASEPLLVGAQSLNNTYLFANVTYYSSKFQQRFSSPQRINLSVTPSAQFTVSSIGNGAAVSAADVPVNFKITNTGTSAASELQLILETAYPLTPVASTAYVDNLQPGASANLTFLVDVDTAGVPGKYPVTLYEQWKQPNGATNQQFTGSSDYFVSVVNPGLGTSGLIIDAIAIIVVIAAAVFIYRKRMAKKPDSRKAKKQGS